MYNLYNGTCLKGMPCNLNSVIFYMCQICINIEVGFALEDESRLKLRQDNLHIGTSRQFKHSLPALEGNFKDKIIIFGLFSFI